MRRPRSDTQLKNGVPGRDAVCIHGHNDWRVSVSKRDGTRYRCMVCHRKSHSEHKDTRVCGEKVIRRVIAALQEGKTLNNITVGKVGDTKVPGLSIVAMYILKNTMKKHPKLKAVITKLAAKNAAKAMADARLKSITIKRATVKRSGDVIAALRKATAPLHESIKDDVFQGMALAVLERSIPVNEIDTAVRKYVTLHYKMFSLYGPVSLSTPIGDEGGGVLIDVIREDQRLWS